MGKKTVPSLNFLWRRSKAINKNAAPASKSPKENDRKSSGSSVTSIDDVAVFYSDQVDKVKMTPIPTAPPSPPKAKLRTASKMFQSMPDLDVCSSLPSPMWCVSPPAVHLTPSPPASAKSEDVTIETVGESTLDRGVRLSALIPETRRLSAEIPDTKRISAEIPETKRLSVEISEMKRLSAEIETKRLSAGKLSPVKTVASKAEESKTSEFRCMEQGEEMEGGRWGRWEGRKGGRCHDLALEINTANVMTLQQVYKSPTVYTA